MRRGTGLDVPSGLVVVDKPAGLTSHDVVASVRRFAGTRRVGHAGTLDPMATGVLVLGVERATKLLGYLALTEKAYSATIRLGQSTVTDDAEGQIVSGASSDGVTEEAVRLVMLSLTGQIDQVPSAVSAVKVEGQRAYARVRAGQKVELPSRQVTVSRFVLHHLSRRAEGLLDLDVEVNCSSGTYVRALARDLGAALGVGGHLVALRRTRVGPFTIADAHTLEQLEERAENAEGIVGVPLDEAVSAAFPRRDVDAAQARLLGHGGWLPSGGITGLYGVFGPDGQVVALVREEGEVAKPEVVLRPAS